MRKQSQAVEWKIAQNDTDWERLRQPPLPDSVLTVSPTLRLKHYCWSISVLLLLLAGTGGWLWHTTQSPLPQPAAQVTATVPLASRVVEQVGEPAVVNLPGDQTAPAWWRQVAQADSTGRAAVQSTELDAHLDTTFQTLEFQGDRAVARILTTTKSGRPTHRQTRFYRRTDAGWVRTDPDAALWGPERSLETPSFVYHFRQNDAQAVIAVAAQMEALYTTLRHHFGLSRTPDPKKLVIDVSVTHSPGQPILHPSEGDRLLVTSPALYLAPVELTDADLLAQSIVIPLIDQVLAQASKQTGIGPEWQPLVSALRLWQLWDLDLPLAAWREEVVRWIYLGVPDTRSGHPVVLPEHYRELCATHSLWLSSPAQLNIPIVCTALDQEDLFLSPRGAREPLTHLDQLGVPERPGADMEGSDTLSVARHPGRTVALATLVEYAVATYGRERLPALVAGLGQYQTWETLFPAVFGVSSGEFEVSWQAYLAAHYGVPARQ